MFEESRTEFMLRWHLYRRWRRPPNPGRQAEYAFYRMMDAISPGLFIDLGANVGMITQKALDHGHDVIAFEPDPVALQHLRQRFAGNPRVRIVPKAVGATARTATFYRRPDGWTEASSLNWTAAHNGGEAIEVEVVDLVDFLRQLREPVAAMKMDIEGAEAECLEAILDAELHHTIAYIIVETHDDFSPDIARRLDRIRERVRHIPTINLAWG